MAIREYFEGYTDGIDASVFSGDILYVKDERDHLKKYCERWLRAIAEVEEDEKA
jgi:hypothetical protein